MKLTSLVLLSALVLLVWISFPLPLQAQERKLPFAPGEKLYFTLKWGFITAGEATLEILPYEEYKGEKALHFKLTAKSTPFIDVFHKVRDEVDSYTDVNFTHSLLYKKNQQEGSYRNDLETTFDWTKKIAVRYDIGKFESQVEIEPGTFDPWAIFYFFRANDLFEGKEFTNPVSDGKKAVIGKVKILKKERISVPAGEFEAYYCEPEIKHIGGVFNKSDKDALYVWVTADDRRLPIMIKSKVIVGSFYAQLNRIENARDTKSEPKQENKEKE